MPERKKLFLKILRAELEDCLEDVEDLAILYERRHTEEEISSYVFQENEALLSRELSGLKNILLSIDDLTIEGYPSLDAFASAVDAMIQRKVLEFEDPEAVYGIAKRKLLKVLKYVSERTV
ncbi:MAG: hypothetical protein WCT14_19965 [Treponemataceae bacterium]